MNTGIDILPILFDCAGIEVPSKLSGRSLMPLALGKPATRTAGKPADSDVRHWDGKLYKSPRSYASEDVIYSRNPLTDELFVVFRTLDGVVQLQAGQTILHAKLADDWFRPTDTDVKSSLSIQNNQLRLKGTAADILGKGIRLTIQQD